MNFELYYPAKPFTQTQGWGVLNTAYEQFGFNHHNGVDFALEADHELHCPVRMKVTDVGFNSSAGNYIRAITTQTYAVLGIQCYVGIMIMHMEKQAVVKGQICEVGDFLGIGDNTGFSTGPHTHMSVYRLAKDIPDENQLGNRLDKDPAYNNTFDPTPFFNGKFAVDYVPPQVETVVEEAQVVATEASQYPSLIAPALNLLKTVGEFISNFRK